MIPLFNEFAAHQLMRNSHHRCHRLLLYPLSPLSLLSYLRRSPWKNINVEMLMVSLPCRSPQPENRATTAISSQSMLPGHLSTDKAIPQLPFSTHHIHPLLIRTVSLLRITASFNRPLLILLRSMWVCRLATTPAIGTDNSLEWLAIARTFSLAYHDLEGAAMSRSSTITQIISLSRNLESGATI